MKLPANIDAMITGHLSISLNRIGVPKDIIFLSLLSYLSRIMCFNGVKIKNDKTKINTFPNVYVLNFMDSGAGKDRTFREIRQITNLFEEEARQLIKSYTCVKKDIIEDHITDNDLKPAEARAYRTSNKIRHINYETSKSTMQGVCADRQVLSDMNLGCSVFKESEFVSYLTDPDKREEQMLNLVIESYDHGEYTPASLKTEAPTTNNKPVAQLFFAFSSVNRIKEKQHARDKLESLLEGGLARRTLFSYPEAVTIKELTIEEMDILDKSLEETTPFIKKELDDFIQLVTPYEINQNSGILNTEEQLLILKKGMKYGFDTKTITLTKEVEDLYRLHEQKSAKESQGNGDNIINASRRGSAWKIIKIAAILAVFETGKFEITKEYWDYALGIVKHYETQLKQFLVENIYADDLLKIYTDYILDNPGSTFTQIRRKASPREKRDDTFAFNNSMKDLEIYCNDLGYEYKESKKGKAKIVSIIKPEPLVETDIVTYSQANHNKKNDPNNFKPRTTDFYKLHEIIQQPFAYSGSQYTDEYRKQSNWICNNSLLFIDIDNDNSNWTTTEALERFKDYKCLVIASKSHNIEKGDHGIKPRFRIVLQMRPMKDVSKEQYTNIMKNFSKEFDLDAYADQGALCDCSRFYFGHDGEYRYTEGKKICDWKDYDIEIQPSNTPNSTPSTFNGSNYDNSKSVLDKSTIFTGNNKNYSYTDIEALAPGKTISVKCYMHNDKSPSAFLGKTPKGTPMFHCQACDETQYFKN